MLAVVLLQLAIWVATAAAFFPWLPVYLDGEKGDHAKQKRERGLGARFSGARPVVVEIAQRASNNGIYQPDAAPREANRLARKRSRRRSHQIPNTLRSLGKRANSFSIVPAAAPTLAHSEGIDQDGTDFSYFIQAQFGSSQKTLYMLIDSGASSTWVMGSDCKSTSCGMHTTFGSADSTSLGPPSKDFSIAYGTGTVSGSIQSDTMNVAGMSMQYQFGIANVTSDDFTHFPFDGILGLSLSQGVNQNFLGLVKQNKLLPANIFGVFINRNSDGPNTGEISFGATDPAKFTGSITYTAVDQSGDGDWVIPMGGIAYDGQVAAGTSGRQAYVDTGTTYIFGPSADVAALHKLVPGSASTDGVTYTVPCGSTKPLTVSFSGVTYTIEAQDWISAPSNGVCYSNIYGHAVINDAWLLGDIFFKNVYAVFDADKSQIGFATRPAAAGGSPTPAGTLTTAPNGAATGSSTEPQGLSGHETGSTAGPAAETAAPKPTVSSFGDQLEGPKYVSIICIVAAVVLAA